MRDLLVCQLVLAVACLAEDLLPLESRYSVVATPEPYRPPAPAPPFDAFDAIDVPFDSGFGPAIEATPLEPPETKPKKKRRRKLKRRRRIMASPLATTPAPAAVQVSSLPPWRDFGLQTTASIDAEAEQSAEAERFVKPEREASHIAHASAFAAREQSEAGAFPYSFWYGVRDAYSGADFVHSEQSSGPASVQGSYQVALPDGRLQIVTYVADHNGYKADVTYQGKAVYPEPWQYSSATTASTDPSGINAVTPTTFRPPYTLYLKQK